MAIAACLSKRSKKLKSLGKRNPNTISSSFAVLQKIFCSLQEYKNIYIGQKHTPPKSLTAVKGVIVCNLDGRVLLYNRRARAIFPGSSGHGMAALGLGRSIYGIFDRHLIAYALENIDTRRRTYIPVQGEIPSPLAPPPGCHFHPRCPHATARCAREAPLLREIAPGRLSACHLNG